MKHLNFALATLIGIIIGNAIANQGEYLSIMAPLIAAATIIITALDCELGG